MYLPVSEEGLLLQLAYVPPRSEKKLLLFKNCLEKEGFFNVDINELKTILSNRENRKKLRNCYLSLSGDHNIISMHLLVKTLKTTKLVSELSYCDNHHYHHYHNYTSFLFTGDAKLETNKYYRQWTTFFDDYLDDVQFCILPHHSSELSFNRNMVSKLPNACFIAQASTYNSYKHPSASVVNEISIVQNRCLWKVNEIENSRINLVYKFI